MCEHLNLVSKETVYFKMEFCNDCGKTFRQDNCCTNPKKAIVRVDTGTKSYHQSICLNCRLISGGMIAKRNIPVGTKVYGIDNKKKDECNDFYTENMREMWDWQAELYRDFQLKQRIEWRKWYNEYLDSEEWQVKRSLVLKRDNYRCYTCGNRATDVHHISYKNLGDEPLEDLVSLCRHCHERVH